MSNPRIASLNWEAISCGVLADDLDGPSTAQIASMLIDAEGEFISLLSKRLFTDMIDGEIGTLSLINAPFLHIADTQAHGLFPSISPGRKSQKLATGLPSGRTGGETPIPWITWMGLLIMLLASYSLNPSACTSFPHQVAKYS